MKAILLSIAFLLSALAAVAQQSPNPNSTEGKSFIGASVSTTGYYVAGKAKYKVMAGVMPYLNIHYGYRLSKRATIQAGLGYGANEVTVSGTRFVLADSSHYETTQIQDIRALVVPFTLKFNPFNPYKRLQVYANATLAPVIGHTKARGTESLKGETSEIYQEEHASVNVVATAGLTANYRVSERLDIFVDGMFLYRSLHNRGALLHHKPVSVGVGLNYNLNLKREK